MSEKKQRRQPRYRLGFMGKCPCGTEFVRKAATQLHCSEKCRRSKYGPMPTTRSTCRQCQRGFTRRRHQHQFCRPQCRARWHWEARKAAAIGCQEKAVA